MTTEQKQQIAALSALQERLKAKLGLPEFGERAFCAVLSDFACPVDYSTLHKLKTRPGYESRNLPRMLADLAIWASAVRVRFFQNPNEWVRGSSYVETPDFALLKMAVAAASAVAKEGRPERAVWCLGDPGAGKSEAIRRIVAAVPNARYTLARQSWCGTYFGALQGLAGALGLGQQRNSAAAEAAILGQLADLDASGNPPVIAIDELEFSGAFLWRLFKMVLNESRAVLLFGCQPVVFDGLKAGAARHAEQLARRGVAVVRMTSPTAKQAGEMAARMLPEMPNATSFGSPLAKAAAVAGRWACVAEVLESLAACGEAPSMADLESAISVYLGRAAIGGKEAA